MTIPDFLKTKKLMFSKKQMSATKSGKYFQYIDELFKIISRYSGTFLIVLLSRWIFRKNFRSSKNKVITLHRDFNAIVIRKFKKKFKDRFEYKKVQRNKKINAKNLKAIIFDLDIPQIKY